jgi:hypothetical protein
MEKDLIPEKIAEQKVFQSLRKKININENEEDDSSNIKTRTLRIKIHITPKQ